jgi:hypothetical protein
MLFRWRKLMAAVIVLWALMDMTVPGVCQSDDLDSVPASAQAASTAVSKDTSPSIVSSDPTNDDSSDQSGPEDCFCCCSHVAPTGFFHVTGLFAFIGYEPPYSQGSPRDFSAFQYHPPKA